MNLCDTNGTIRGEGRQTSQNIEMKKQPGGPGHFLSHIADIWKVVKKGNLLNIQIYIHTYMEPKKSLICHIEKEISSESSQTISLKLFQITLQPFQLGCFKKTGMIEELLIEFIVTQMSAALHRFDRHN